ncbi:hypothetical protein M9H77_18636 [Catharanthus roseus]|uniref:Uncharacterized protein n=1 Tax=Catharanthus roseus TaxID=4058 RepID=A0ACC0B8A6_CATRO|nr:hypothetical protein M9H77_18636 [Catharanthus roseus]
MNFAATSLLSLSEQEKLIDKLEIFTIKGRDKHGVTILQIIGKFFPARTITVEALNKYLAEKVYPRLAERPFSVVYVHTQVNRAENFPGLSRLRSIYEAIPNKVRDNLETVYFLHPGLQSRLFLAIFGSLLFGGGLYWKVKYVNRLDLLWDKVRRKEIEIPEFVYEHDKELENWPVMDYGLESDHPRGHVSPPMLDSALQVYSMRCIA